MLDTVESLGCCFSHSLTLSSPSFMTPFHVAAERGHNDVLEVLQKHGAKVPAWDVFQDLVSYFAICRLLRQLLSSSTIFLNM